MGTIRIQGVTTQFGGHIVLDDVSLELNSGRIVGLVGPNGAGKTTVFRLITKQLKPEFGTVTSSKSMRVGYLSQEPSIDLDKTLHDEVLSVFEGLFALEHKMHELSEQMGRDQGDALERSMKEYDRVNELFIAAGGYEFEARLGEILGGLGFSEQDLKLPVSALSGGQKCRAALAKLLLQDHTYLLLDEPTNHLDIDAVRWLERFLAGHKGGAAIISHDRYLLDRVVDGVVEVDRTKLSFFPGNYSNYVKTRELRALTQDRQFDKDKAFIEKERAFIAKHLAGQRTAEAKGRRSRLNREIKAGVYVQERSTRKKTIAFEFDMELPRDRTMIETDQLAKAFDDKILFDELSLQIASGQRLGITGPNGTGKSSLLKVMLGEFEASNGEVHIDPKAEIGYYAQEAHDLDENATILESIHEVRQDFTEERVRSLLGAFLFSGDAVFKRVGSLSGGEQSRVRLIRLLLKNPNVLVLDEPTNHLDIPSREALETALEAYPGTIVAVSHDRYFLDRIVTHLLVMRSGSHRAILGNYSDYVRQLEAQAPDAGKTTGKRTKQSQRKSGSKPAPKRTKSRFEKMSLDNLEAAIIEFEEQLAGCHAQFADQNVYKDVAALASVRDESERLQRELEEAEAAWSLRAQAG